MSMTIQRAAAALVHRIRAPSGVVNTYVSRDSSGPFICVMIDPLYWNTTPDIPNPYKGHRVVIEKREPTVAFR